MYRECQGDHCRDHQADRSDPDRPDQADHCHQSDRCHRRECWSDRYHQGCQADRSDPDRPDQAVPADRAGSHMQERWEPDPAR